MDNQSPGEERLEHLSRLVDILFREIRKTGALTRAERVEMGVLLWGIGNKAKEQLEPLKGFIRDAAREILDGKPGVVDFKGSTGSSCRVTIPPTQIRLTKTAKIEALKRGLGESFSECFTSVVEHTPRMEALKEKLQDGPPEPSLLESIEMVSPSPRVQFSGE